jgi:vacuolar-type H+-ATPase catalytic subunit A/Vma1
VDEGRKRVLAIVAGILVARKLAQYDGGKRVPATVAAISDAVRWAEEIMREIDERWPSPRGETSSHVSRLKNHKASSFCLLGSGNAR